MMEVDPALFCDAKHKTEEERHKESGRRLTVLEKSLETNLTRIYTKFDEVSQIMLKRLPIPVTIIITLLSSAVTGLLVAFMMRNH